MKINRLSIMLLVTAQLLLPALNTANLPASQASIVMRKVHPNPFTDHTTFDLTMPTSGHIRIAVHDILGKLIKTLFDGQHEAGKGIPVPWDGKDEGGTPVIPGIYICSLFSEDSFVTSVKVVKIPG